MDDVTDRGIRMGGLIGAAIGEAVDAANSPCDCGHGTFDHSHSLGWACIICSCAKFDNPKSRALAEKHKQVIQDFAKQLNELEPQSVSLVQDPLPANRFAFEKPLQDNVAMDIQLSERKAAEYRVEQVLGLLQGEGDEALLYMILIARGLSRDSAKATLRRLKLEV